MEPKKKKKNQIDDIPSVYKAIAVSVVCLMVFVGISAFLRVNNIVVEGINLYSAEQVAEASGVSKGNSLFYVNSRSIQNKITSKLPYVTSVTVKRDFPETLHIIVTESAAVAYIPFAGEAIVIDAGGRALDIFKYVPGSNVEIGGKRLMEIRGIVINEAEIGKRPEYEPGNEPNFNAMRDILAAFEKEALTDMIDYLDIGNITNISCGVSDRFKVLIGGLRDYRQKISSLRNVIASTDELYPNARGYLNMTDPSGEYRFIPYDY